TSVRLDWPAPCQSERFSTFAPGWEQAQLMPANSVFSYQYAWSSSTLTEMIGQLPIPGAPTPLLVFARATLETAVPCESFAVPGATLAPLRTLRSVVLVA